MDVLAAMRTFVSIVDQGSLTGAARVLDRAPPTIVRALASLEDHLGARLLTRTTRQMALTEEGRVYLDRCRRILADVVEAEASVVATETEPRGPIRVTAPVLFGQRHVSAPVVEFTQRYPEVEIDLVLLDRVVNLIEEGFDVGVRIGRLPDSSMIALPIGSMRRVVVASPSLLARTGVPTHPRELAALPCVHHSGSAPSRRWKFREAARDEDVSISARFSSNQVKTVVDACLADLGFGSFLSYQVEPEVRAGRLQVVLGTFEVDPIPVQIVYADAQLMSPRLRLFVDAMKQALRARPEIEPSNA